MARTTISIPRDSEADRLVREIQAAHETLGMAPPSKAAVVTAALKAMLSTMTLNAMSKNPLRPSVSRGNKEKSRPFSGRDRDEPRSGEES
jgi:hypothetical protein